MMIIKYVHTPGARSRPPSLSPTRAIAHAHAAARSPQRRTQASGQRPAAIPGVLAALRWGGLLLFLGADCRMAAAGEATVDPIQW